MPWMESNPVEQRVEFINKWKTGLFTMAELCEKYGISRKTGYKWWDRYDSEGIEGLIDRSRAPQSTPHETPERLVDAILDLRRRRPSWGPKKIVRRLSELHPKENWPAPSTAGEILKRNGMVEEKKRRRKLEHPGKPYIEAYAPNDVWSADYKGQFRTGNSKYCYPLTITDNHSRYVLECRAKSGTTYRGARPVFADAFRLYGLPKAILTDNGTPFGNTRGLGNLSRLSAWWVTLGIRPLYIEPGHPEQNGKHERMHRTLKAETTRPAAWSNRSQQAKFDEFQVIFNDERPHEALDGDTPDSHYEPSERRYGPGRRSEMSYPNHMEVRKVCGNGSIKWHDEFVSVGRAFVGYRIGLEEVDEALWSVYFGRVLLGRFDEWERRIHG